MAGKKPLASAMPRDIGAPSLTRAWILANTAFTPGFMMLSTQTANARSSVSPASISTASSPMALIDAWRALPLGLVSAAAAAASLVVSTVSIGLRPLRRSSDSTSPSEAPSSGPDCVAPDAVAAR